MSWSRKEEKFPDLKNLMIQTAEGDKKFLSLVHAVGQRHGPGREIFYRPLPSESLSFLSQETFLLSWTKT